MERSGDSGKRRFLRRTVAGAGWAFLLWIALWIAVAGWFWYGLSGGFASNLWPTLQYSLLVAATLNLHVAPVLLVLGLMCGAAWAWVVEGCPWVRARP